MNVCVYVGSAFVELEWWFRIVTLVLDLRLGSSRDCRSPAPRVGSWVWNTDTRPPVGDMSLYAACRAGPRALWVSRVCVNIPGRAFSRSFTSCEHMHKHTDNAAAKTVSHIKACVVQRYEAGKWEHKHRDDLSLSHRHTHKDMSYNTEREW